MCPLSHLEFFKNNDDEKIREDRSNDGFVGYKQSIRKAVLELGHLHIKKKKELDIKQEDNGFGLSLYDFDTHNDDFYDEASQREAMANSNSLPLSIYDDINVQRFVGLYSADGINRAQGNVTGFGFHST